MNENRLFESEQNTDVSYELPLEQRLMNEIFGEQQPARAPAPISKEKIDSLFAPIKTMERVQSELPSKQKIDDLFAPIKPATTLEQDFGQKKQRDQQTNPERRAESRAKMEPIVTKVECYLCSGAMEVSTTKVPVVITCPYCGEEGLVE
jgi:hypothetical protein